MDASDETIRGSAAGSGGITGQARAHSFPVALVRSRVVTGAMTMKSIPCILANEAAWYVPIYPNIQHSPSNISSHSRSSTQPTPQPILLNSPCSPYPHSSQSYPHPQSPHPHPHAETDSRPWYHKSYTKGFARSIIRGKSIGILDGKVWIGCSRLGLGYQIRAGR